MEYGLLALFAFRAARLSFRNPITRIALLAGGFTALVVAPCPTPRNRVTAREKMRNTGQGEAPNLGAPRKPASSAT